jgi:hypothetical protein
MLHERGPGWGPNCIDLLCTVTKACETEACAQGDGAMVPACLGQQLQPLAQKLLLQLAVTVSTAAELGEPADGCCCVG